MPSQTGGDSTPVWTSAPALRPLDRDLDDIAGERGGDQPTDRLVRDPCGCQVPVGERGRQPLGEACDQSD